MSKSYTTDVTTLSDDELKILSSEMEDAYRRADHEGEEYWTDDEAEDRHLEMSRELRRRWELANPEEAKIRREWYEKMWKEMGAVLRNSIVQSAPFYEGAKIGCSIIVRRPNRYT